MRNLFFVSDTHWGHKNIIKYSNRPYENVAEMNEALIQNWNAQVKPADEIWHLGDFAFMQFPEFTNILRRLNGAIHFVSGNHDQMIHQNRFEILKQGKIKSIQYYAEVKIAGTMLVLFHYGQRTWNKAHYGSIHLFGHSHGSLPAFGKSVDVGVDNKEVTPEYRPIHLDEILKFMSTRDFVKTDHHGIMAE